MACGMGLYEVCEREVGTLRRGGRRSAPVAETATVRLRTVNAARRRVYITAQFVVDSRAENHHILV